MSLSREKINLLSKFVLGHLSKNNSIDFLKEDNEIRLKIVKVITSNAEIDDRIEIKVKKILASYSKKIYEGTREWDVMYTKLYDEEMSKIKGFKE